MGAKKQFGGFSKTCVVVGGLILAFAVFLYILDNSDDKYIELVKNCLPNLYPDSTYGEAFGYFFDNTEWKYYETKKYENGDDDGILNNLEDGYGNS